MKYLILLLFITSSRASFSYFENYCTLKLADDSEGFDCNFLSETSVVYETCCAGRDLKNGIYEKTGTTKSRNYFCGTDDEDICVKRTKFCEWKDGLCVQNPCAKSIDNGTVSTDSFTEACENAEFNGEQCKWVSHEKYSYCSSASSLTVGLSSLLVLYSTFNY